MPNSAGRVLHAVLSGFGSARTSLILVSGASVLLLCEGALGADAPSAHRVKLAVMDVRVSSSIPETMVPTLTTALSEEFGRLGPFEAISSQDVKQMLAFERQKDLLGCESDTSCLAEIGGALGADYLVGATVTLLDHTYLLQLQLIDISRSKVAARVSREYEGGPIGLVKEMGTAAQYLVRDILAAHSGSIELVASEEGATVKLDGSAVAVTPLQGPLSASEGIHALAVEKDGFIRHARDVTVLRNATLKVEVVLILSEDARKERLGRAQMTRLGAWLGTGLGVVALATSGALFTAAKGRSDALNRDIAAYSASPLRTDAEAAALNDRRASIGRLDSAVVVTGVVALVAAGVGLALFGLGDPPSRYADPKSGVGATFVPSASWGGGGALMVVW